MSNYINKCLARGKGTGAIMHPTPDQKSKLQVRCGARGRGLFAMSHIEKGSDDAMLRVRVQLITSFCAGDCVAIGIGRLVAERDPDHHCITWTKTTLFQFDAASEGNLAVLANTAWTAGTGAVNNCRYIQCKRGAQSPSIKVRATCMTSVYCVTVCLTGRCNKAHPCG
jgi:hypothetical protein